MKKIEINREHRLRLKSILLLALLTIYPFAIHNAIINGHEVAALLIFLSVPVLFTTRRWPGRLLLALASVGTIALLSLVVNNIGQTLLYLMPILINAGLAIVFGKTLLSGRTPLITSFSILFRGKLEPRVISYTRRVTQLWTLFFILLAMESLMLALFASIEIWSLFANIINYIFTGLLFSGEYLFRIHHFNDLEHPSFTRFVRNMSKVSFNDFNNQ